MWEQQLAAMLECGHLDQVAVSDLGVTYAAETGDISFVGELVHWCPITSRPGMLLGPGSISYGRLIGRSYSWSGGASHGDESVSMTSRGAIPSWSRSRGGRLPRAHSVSYTGSEYAVYSHDGHGNDP